MAHQGLVDEVGADEAGASGDEDVHRTRSDTWELGALSAHHGRRHHATGARSSPREAVGLGRWAGAAGLRAPER